MERISINVSVEIEDFSSLSEQTKKLISAISSLTEANPEVSDTPKSSAPKRTSKAKVEVAEAPKVEVAEAPKVEVAEAPKSNITIDDVRKALGKKVNEHRDEIRAKLLELGAPSVTKLDETRYGEMFNYLETL